MSEPPPAPDLPDVDFTSPDRYHRQALLPGIGGAGQARLAAARVLVVGCGALGCGLIDHLARAGVGALVLVDRDVVELTNLQRQTLYGEDDVARGRPKAHAAAAAVARVNRGVEVHAHAVDFGPGNAATLADGCDVIVDGLDSFETRYLLNDLAVRHGTPYIYGGAVGTSGMSMPILPAAGDGPCLRCLFADPPPAGTAATCDTAGVLGPVVTTVAARQAAEAIKLIAAGPDAVDRRLVTIDLWTGRYHAADVSAARRPDCPTCGGRNFEWLEGRRGTAAASLCGRGAVQILGRGEDADPATEAERLTALATRLAAHGTFVRNEWLVRGRLDSVRSRRGDPIDLTVFADGRTLVHGTDDPAEARSLHARYVGH